MNYDKIYPTIDLHGLDRIEASIKTKEFLNDYIGLGKKDLCIIHGISGGIIKKTVHDILKKDKRIKEFHVEIFNPGMTLVKVWDNVK